MGLAARRAIEDFKTKSFPDYKKRIDAAAGFNVNLEVAWDTLSNDEYAHMYDESFSKVFFIPLAEAFKAVCCDEMGKKALKVALKKVIVGGSENYNAENWTFEKGTLTLHHSPFSNVDDVKERTTILTRLLENHL